RRPGGCRPPLRPCRPLRTRTCRQCRIYHEVSIRCWSVGGRGCRYRNAAEFSTRLGTAQMQDWAAQEGLAVNRAEMKLGFGPIADGEEVSYCPNSARKPRT